MKVEGEGGGGEGNEKGDMASHLAGVYAKDWVNDFVEPDESMMEEGTKTIDFLLKRCRLYTSTSRLLEASTFLSIGYLGILNRRWLYS